jgi:pyruvate dehydrogenase E1 component beta subunit
LNKPITLSRAFADGVAEEMQRDPSIFIIGTDIYERGGHFAQVKGLGAMFGRERVRDAPISEAAMVAAGVGAAMAGMRPIVDLNFIDFALGAMDEIVNQAAKMRYMSGSAIPLVIRATSGTALFAAQHNNSLDGMLSQTPGLLVAAPSTPADAKGLVKTALRGEDPVVYLMHKRLAGTRGVVEDNVEPIPFGRGLIRRAGTALTIVTYGACVPKVLKAADELANAGIDCEVIDLRTLFPLDYDMIETSVRKTRRALVVTEEPRIGGVAGELVSSIQENVFDHLDAPVRRLGGIYSPIPHSPPLVEQSIPQAADVVRAATALVAARRATQ